MLGLRNIAIPGEMLRDAWVIQCDSDTISTALPITKMLTDSRTPRPQSTKVWRHWRLYRKPPNDNLSVKEVGDVPAGPPQHNWIQNQRQQVPTGSALCKLPVGWCHQYWQSGISNTFFPSIVTVSITIAPMLWTFSSVLFSFPLLTLIETAVECRWRLVPSTIELVIF